MREQHSNDAANSQDITSSNDNNAPAIYRHDDANDTNKQQNLMAPNHLQK
jgi:hypothetical protein